MSPATLGTVKVICESDQLDTLAAVLPKRTDPAVVPKPLPAMVTFTPAWAVVGPMEPTSGAAAAVVACHTDTVCAGRVNAVTGLLPPDPAFTVMLRPPNSPPR